MRLNDFRPHASMRDSIRPNGFGPNNVHQTHDLYSLQMRKVCIRVKYFYLINNRIAVKIS